MAKLFSMDAGSNPDDQPEDEPRCECECGDCDCCEETCTAESDNPVRYYSGELVLRESDLSTGGFGFGWGHTRSYSNQMSRDHDYGNGFNWLVREWGYLTNPNGDGSFVVAVLGTGKSYRFDKTGDSYTARYGSRAQLEASESEGVLRLILPGGVVWEFHDFTQVANVGGTLSQVVARSGLTTSLSYSPGSRRPSEAVRTAEGVTESFYYVYDGNDRLQSVTLRRQTAGSGWNSVRRCVYSYYAAAASHGNEGDLQSATEQVPSGSSGWSDIGTHYYRYWKDDAGGVGFRHGLKYALRPEAYRRLTADVGAADPLTATDAQVTQYADYYFEYDSDRRVTREKAKAGSIERSFAYTANPATPAEGYNNWQTKTVETLPSGHQNIVYTNHIGQPLAKEFKAGSNSWTEFWEYDNDSARKILHAHPSAVASYSDSGASISATLNATGLVEIYRRYANTTATAIVAGGIENEVEHEIVRKGNTSNEVKLKTKKYFRKTEGRLIRHHVAEETVYRKDDGTEPVTTSYEYTWHPGTLQVKQKTTILPKVSAAQNGESVHHFQYDVYDLDGRLVWNQGPRGFLRYLEYDNPTGGLVKQIEDVDTSRTDITGLPSAWATPSGGGLHLVSDYELDNRGRTVQELGPEHEIDLSGIAKNIRQARWTVYDDENHETRSARGYQTTTDSAFTLINPVSISKRDDNDRVVETVEAKKGSAAMVSGGLSSSDTFAQSSYTRWTTQTYNDAGRMTRSRVYHSIPSSGEGSPTTNYDQTTYGYDDEGLQDRVATPGGTITRTVYDARDRVESVWLGTDDMPSSGVWSPSNTAGTNLVVVASYEYDDGGLGDGNRTKETRPVDADSANDRITKMEYDWRDRLTASVAVETASREFRTEYELDNLGRAAVVEEKRDDSEDPTLIGKSESLYDDRGRVCRTKRYGVDDSGNVGHALTDQTWYDCCGNVIKSQPAGSQAFTKSVYDGVARQIATYQGYDTDESSYAEAASVTGDSIFEQTETSYDAASNVVATTSLSRYHDNTTSTGTLTAGADARPNHTAFYHDGLGRMITTAEYGNQGSDSTVFTRSVTAPVPSSLILISQIGYNAAGEAEDQVNTAGQTTRSVYDNAGRITNVTQNHGSTPTEEVQTAYTPDGQVKTLTAINADTGDQVTTYTYGVTLTDSGVASNDLQASVTYPNSGIVRYNYNRQGERTELADQNGSVHNYAYDRLNRQIEDKVSTLGAGVDGAVRRIAWCYDHRQRLERVTSYDAALGGSVTSDVQFAYNDYNHVVTEHQQHGSAVNTSTSPRTQYGYANGSSNTVRRESVTYPDGTSLLYGYGTGVGDALSRVEKLTWDSTVIAVYDYLGRDLVIELKYPEPTIDVQHTLASGAANSYSGIDRFGRVIDLQWNQGSTELVRLKYGYDRVGNRLYRRDEAARSNSAKFDELYSYDGLNRLVEFDRGELNSGNNGFSGSTTLGQGWTLDSTGNWDGYDQTVQDALSQTRTHNAVNEITGVSETAGLAWADPAHDANGNMTTIAQPAAVDDSYTGVWDAWNRLVRLFDDVSGNTVAEHEYDGLNRRIMKKDYQAGVLDQARHVFFSDRWQAIEERTGVSTIADRQFVWGQRYVDDLVLRDHGAERLYALHDALFNVVLLADNTGDVVQRFAYQPYGQSDELEPDFSSYSGTDYEWEHRFTGRELDFASGLQLNRHRLLHLQLGRWLSPDPIGHTGSHLNLYSYVRNKPVLGIDPIGLYECTQLYGYPEISRPGGPPQGSEWWDHYYYGDGSTVDLETFDPAMFGRFKSEMNSKVRAWVPSPPAPTCDEETKTIARKISIPYNFTASTLFYLGRGSVTVTYIIKAKANCIQCCPPDGPMKLKSHTFTWFARVSHVDAFEDVCDLLNHFEGNDFELPGGTGFDVVSSWTAAGRLPPHIYNVGCP